MIYFLIGAGIVVIALCLHYSTRSYGLPTKRLMQSNYDLFSNWDRTSSDGSDGSIPGDPWGGEISDDLPQETDLGCYN